MGCSGHKTPTRADPCPSELPCRQRETKNQEQAGEQSVTVRTQRKGDPHARGREGFKAGGPGRPGEEVAFRKDVEEVVERVTWAARGDQRPRGPGAAV